MTSPTQHERWTAMRVTWSCKATISGSGRLIAVVLMGVAPFGCRSDGSTEDMGVDGAGFPDSGLTDAGAGDAMVDSNPSCSEFGESCEEIPCCEGIGCVIVTPPGEATWGAM